MDGFEAGRYSTAGKNPSSRFHRGDWSRLRRGNTAQLVGFNAEARKWINERKARATVGDGSQFNINASRKRERKKTTGIKNDKVAKDGGWTVERGP
jgi:hypothetical protein